MTAQARKTILAQMAVVGTAIALIVPVSVRAVASVQTCTTANTCVIGEHLYDDNYALETTGTCTLTAKNPDTTAYLTDQAMTQTNGWYAYTFTAPATTGYYPTQVCCTVAGDTMCLDKSFQVEAVSSSSLTTSDIASAVWGYSGRTLSGFGDLVSNIWDHSGRNVDANNLGTVVRDVWAYSTRTITGGTSTSSTSSTTITTRGDLDEIKLMLERLVNAPIIENSLEAEDLDLGAQILETDQNLTQLSLDHDLALSQVGLIGLKWASLDVDEAVTALAESESRIAQVSEKIAWLKDTWGWSELKGLTTNIETAKTKLASSRSKLETSGKSTSAFQDLKVGLKALETVQNLIGKSEDKTTATTAYGRFNAVKQLASVWDEKQQKAEKLLASWKELDDKSASTQSDSLYKEVMSVNKIPQAAAALTTKLKDLSVAKKLKNKVLGLKGLIAVNRQLLARAATTSLASTWLEEGSVIFKTLVTNPSTLLTQTVPVKYYLPTEVKQEDIIDHDSAVEVKFDVEKGQLYVTGEVTVPAGKSQTISVRVQDNWEISEAEVTSLKTQVAELSKPLAKTSFFAQGVTLSSDINASLDKVLSLQGAAVTPEQKIRAFREAKIEMNSAQTKLTSLQDLVAQAGSAGSLLGFVGGAQVMAVWSLVIIGLAGFVFLALYMKRLASAPKVAVEKSPSSYKHILAKEAEEPVKKNRSYKWVLHTVVIILTSSATTAALTWQVLARTQPVVPQVLPAAIEVLPEPELGRGGPEMVKVSLPGSETIEAIKLAEKGTKTQVDINGFAQWVETKYVQAPSAEEQVESPLEVVIGTTETGWLRVRDVPGGQEIARVNSGDRYVLLDQQSGWMHIELTDGSTGWIVVKYAEVE